MKKRGLSNHYLLSSNKKKSLLWPTYDFNLGMRAESAIRFPTPGLNKYFALAAFSLLKLNRNTNLLLGLG